MPRKKKPKKMIEVIIDSSYFSFKKVMSPGKVPAHLKEIRKTFEAEVIRQNRMKYAQINADVLIARHNGSRGFRMLHTFSPMHLKRIPEGVYLKSTTNMIYV